MWVRRLCFGVYEGLGFWGFVRDKGVLECIRRLGAECIRRLGALGLRLGLSLCGFMCAVPLCAIWLGSLVYMNTYKRMLHCETLKLLNFSFLRKPGVAHMGLGCVHWVR